MWIMWIMFKCTDFLWQNEKYITKQKPDTMEAAKKNWPRGALYLISFISVFNLATSTQHKQINANNAL